MSIPDPGSIRERQRAHVDLSLPLYLYGRCRGDHGLGLHGPVRFVAGRLIEVRSPGDGLEVAGLVSPIRVLAVEARLEVWVGRRPVEGVTRQGTASPLRVEQIDDLVLKILARGEADPLVLDGRLDGLEQIAIRWNHLIA